MANLFEKLKVVELAGVLAGPAVGMFFAELGAQVVKVENRRTGGDTTRHWKLPQEDPNSPFSAYFHAVNWGKQSLFVDLSTDADRLALQALLRDADVVITNFMRGAAEPLGLDYPTLSALNPRLIHASITAYGPEDDRPGFDVAIQAETGWLSMTGEADGPPVKLPVALMDLLAAHQLKEGILVALLQRHQTGRGSDVTVSLFDAGVSALANQASNWLNVSHLPQRMGSLHPNIAPYGEIFQSTDGQLLMLATGTERHFRQLCELLGLPEVAADPRFQTNALRLTYRSDLARLLAAAFEKLEAADVLQRCRAEQVPVAPVRDLAGLFRLPEAQNLVLTEALPDGTVSRRVRTTVFKINT